MRMVKVRILPPQPIHLKPQDLVFSFLTKYSFLTIDLVHEPGRAILHGVAVLISDDLPIDPQGNSWVAVPQLPLYDSHGCAVCEQSAGSAVTEAVNCRASSSLLKLRCS